MEIPGKISNSFAEIYPRFSKYLNIDLVFIIIVFLIRNPVIKVTVFYTHFLFLMSDQIVLFWTAMLIHFL